MKLRSALLVAALALGVLLPTACSQDSESIRPSSSALAPGSLGTAGETTSSLSGPARVRFSLLEPEGNVAADVHVYVADTAGHALAETSAATGYSITGLEAGSYIVRVDGRGTKYMSLSRVVALQPGENQVSFTLQVGRTISGRVTWTGRPWIWVETHPSPDDGSEIRQVQVSGGSSGFTIEGLAPGRYTVSADVFWYGGDSRETATVIDVTAHDATGVDLDIGRLAPLPTTTINVDTTTGHD